MPDTVVQLVVARTPDCYTARRGWTSPNVLLLSAFQDDETTGDGPVNGVFTPALLGTWANGSFVGDYRSAGPAHRASNGSSPATTAPSIPARTSDGRQVRLRNSVRRRGAPTSTEKKIG